jgi:ADP-ribosylglycohydrolase
VTRFLLAHHPSTRMPLPPDYLERVYAGVLGKIIGVYLGRPFEGWSYDRIMAELGEVEYYVHEKRGVPLIVTDDDISGTFTFLRALPDYGNSLDLTPEQIGQTWLNYLIEKKTVLWWGGMGNSTEHTAYLRLKHGIPAPRSGSIETNGQVVAEQIGAQIFIDGWGMVAPGDPERAADLARRAASVSHDGEAIYGAQVVAAMEAAAFLESDIDRLIDTAAALIPRDSVIFRLIADLREWHAGEKDWRKTRELLAGRYGYDKYGGNCHMVPNHGLIIHSLLHGGGDFQKSLTIVNTSGWDTDCNSGNVGCLLGIRGGLAALESGPDWRGPVADRMYLPTADSGRAITDAVSETYRIVNIGRALAGEPALDPGARFHFSLPGSVQGFIPEDSVECRGVVQVRNATRHRTRVSDTGREVVRVTEGRGFLEIRYRNLARGRAARVATATFIPPSHLSLGGYGLIASPTLYPGQTLRARVVAEPRNDGPVECRLYLRVYGEDDALVRVHGPNITLAPGSGHEFTWRIPDTGGAPVAEVGVELLSDLRANGSVNLHFLTWDGTPDVTFAPAAGNAWRRAWVQGVDQAGSWGSEPLRVIQDEGTGLLIQGTREWTDYRVTATVTPHLAASCGIAARVQGMRRYYALLLVRGGVVRLVKALDGTGVLAEQALAWELGQARELSLEVVGTRIRAFADGRALLDVTDSERPLEGGAIALICEEGRMAVGPVRVEPVS